MRGGDCVQSPAKAESVFQGDGKLPGLRAIVPPPGLVVFSVGLSRQLQGAIIGRIIVSPFGPDEVRRTRLGQDDAEKGV